MPAFFPENDWSFLLERPVPADLPSVSLVIPVYNRIGLLQHTLAGLAAQAVAPHEVVIVDDGSDEDVSAAVQEMHLPFPRRVLRQDRDGYGAGRARNRGAAAATGEVVLFVDADCLPSPQLVERHAGWHGRGEGVVVIGARRYADTTAITLDEVRKGIEIETTDDREDWRDTLSRRSLSLRHGNEAYRAFLSGNVSLRRTDFEASGGFDESFTAWGGEDTELGWRLFDAGLVFVPDDTAAIFHQEQEDEGPAGWRRLGRAANEARLTDLIPHRFYRKDTSTPHAVPKVSVIVAPGAQRRSPEVWSQLLAQRLADWEAFFPFDDIHFADGRFRDSDDLATAIHTARGEYLLLLSGAAAPDPLLLDRLVAGMDDSPRMPIGRVRYHGPPEGAADAAWGFDGLPAVIMCRRRDWHKADRAGLSHTATFEAIEGSGPTLVVGDTPHVTLPEPGSGHPVSLLPAVATEVRAAEAIRTRGPIGRAVYSAARLLRRRRRGETRPVLRHFGDERSAAAVGAVVRSMAVSDSARRPGAVVFGGGATLDDPAVEGLRSIDSGRLERAVAGAHLGDGAGPLTAEFLATCIAVGLATDEDLARAREIGFDGAATVVGHPADGGADAVLDALAGAVVP
jgi:glycosyltransferase involved in cell wall biosynthesis